MFSLKSRWIDQFQGREYYKQLVQSCKPGNDPARFERERAKRAQRPLMMALFVGGFAGLAMIVLVAALMFGADPQPGAKPNYVATLSICVGVVGLAGVITYLFSLVGHTRIQKRMDAIASLCGKQEGLTFVGQIEIKGEVVGSLPWFITEEFENVHGLAIGEFNGAELCFIECDQTIDPVLKVTQSQMLQVASQLVVRRNRRLRKRDMEVAVFGEPLEFLPDMLIVPHRDPNRAYFGRALNGDSFDLPLPSVLSKKYWATAAEFMDGDSFLSQELVRALAERPWAMVQIIGGQCCVFTQQWDGANPGEAAFTAEAVQSNLEFATQVFQALKSKSPNVSKELTEEQVSSSNQTDVSGGVAVATQSSTATWESIKNSYLEPQARECAANLNAASVEKYDVNKFDVKLETKRVRHSMLVSVLLLGFGVPMVFLCGFGSLIGGFNVFCGFNSPSWPTVDAVVVTSKVESSKNVIDPTLPDLHHPVIEYEYTVENKNYSSSKIQFGSGSHSSNRAEAEAIVKQYSQGAIVQANYLPYAPNIATLEVGTGNQNQQLVVFATSIVFTCVGIGLCALFFIGKEV